ncbi:MAG: hypothetical protein AABY32_07145 [Nanoarchaeota archaeon]
MKATELILFNKDETSRIISEFDIKTKIEKGKAYVIDEDGEIKCCEVCKRKLEVDKIGSVASGSRKIFCDNPLCLSGWVAKNKL